MGYPAGRLQQLYFETWHRIWAIFMASMISRVCFPERPNSQFIDEFAGLRESVSNGNWQRFPRMARLRGRIERPGTGRTRAAEIFSISGNFSAAKLKSAKLRTVKMASSNRSAASYKTSAESLRRRFNHAYSALYDARVSAYAVVRTGVEAPGRPASV